MTPEAKALGDRSAFSDTMNRGMTYRQWLVGQAMAGLLAMPKDSDITGTIKGEGDVAKVAISNADHVLELLAKKETA